MILTETIDDGRRERRYSDAGVMLRQVETGTLYEDAVDVVPCAFTYEETDEPVGTEEISDSEALAILLGKEADANDESDSE